MIPRRALLAALLLPWPARAETPADLPLADLTPSDRDAIAAVIESQIAAFRANDAQAAFAHASPMIQALFGTPDRFLAMVRAGYPPVHRPRQVAFGALVERDGRLVQKVELIGPDGAPALALYTMLRTAEGWRIDGCMLTESENPST